MSWRLVSPSKRLEFWPSGMTICPPNGPKKCFWHSESKPTRLNSFQSSLLDPWDVLLWSTEPLLASWHWSGSYCAVCMPQPTAPESERDLTRSDWHVLQFQLTLLPTSLSWRL